MPSVECKAIAVKRMSREGTDDYGGSGGWKGAWVLTSSRGICSNPHTLTPERAVRYKSGCPGVFV